MAAESLPTETKNASAFGRIHDRPLNHRDTQNAQEGAHEIARPPRKIDMGASHSISCKEKPSKTSGTEAAPSKARSCIKWIQNGFAWAQDSWILEILCYVLAVVILGLQAILFVLAHDRPIGGDFTGPSTLYSPSLPKFLEAL
jgi:hypothetical protein